MKSEREHPRRPRKRYWRFVGALVIGVVVLNALAFVPGFCDLYATHVYPVITEPLSRACTHVPVAIGELLMFAGIALVALAALVVFGRILLHRREGFKRFARGYLKFVLAIVLCTLLLFTLNYLIPFRATPLSQTLANSSEHTLEQVESLRNGIVEHMNSTAAQAPRGDDGHLAFPDDVDGQVAHALHSLGREFPRLSGFYPAPKAALCSDVLEWMGIGGYTYPYTMEVTYNRHVSKLFYPVLSVHESVHHKGYYLESEAEFLSYLACTRSSDPVLRYSGYQNMCYYVERAYQSSLLETYEENEARERYQAQPTLSDQVQADIDYDAQQRKEAYENAVDKRAEEALSGAAKGAADFGWSAQGQILQENSYAGAVELLLTYTYDL